MNDSSKDRANVVAARRRLVRGVFGVPAALTLCSGSVYAAASSQQCLVNAAADPVDAPLDTTTWVRVELWKLGSGDKLSTWVWGGDLKYLQASDTLPPYLSATQWQCVSAGKDAGYKKADVKSSTPTKGTSSPVRSGQYVAVRVNAGGKIIGVQGIETGGTAIAASCWASINILA